MRAELPDRCGHNERLVRQSIICYIRPLIALLAYVISPVDAIPGPVDDMIMCLLYAVMNYKGVFKELPEWKTDLWGSLSLKCLDCVKEIGYRGKKISNCSTVLTVPKRELGTKKTKSGHALILV